MSNNTDYNFSEIETRWQSAWTAANAYRTSPDTSRPKSYILDMFPYPSGAGLHLGHCENYAITDILARFKRAQGHNVLYPIGWDAFGLPTENYAVKTGRHPADVTRENIDNFKRQLAALGVSYDFDREINTTDPKYFRWTQWIFLQLFRRNLAYVEEKPVWWCPALGTVLANEEVIDGKSEVGKHPVERRPLRQWVLRITAYADRLLEDLKNLDWPDSTKRMQEAWIGRSEGSEVEFDIDQHPEKIRVFTTRVDTLHGATYMVLAPEHALVSKITSPAQQAAVAAYIKAAAGKSDLERAELTKDKTGVFTGAHAINPVNNKKIPVWIADYVLATYGTGAIMAVPAHDERDYDFAKKYELPITQVIAPGKVAANISSQESDKPARELTVAATSAETSAVSLPFIDKSPNVRLINSGDLDGLTPAEAKQKLDARFAAENRGHAATQFKLRDWLFSRQRYWGEPFPIVWISETDYKKVTQVNMAQPASPCSENGTGFRPADGTAATSNLQSLISHLPPTPVTTTINGETRYALALPESALPLTLPDVVNYQPTGTGESPLAAMTDWLEIWHEPATGKAVPATQAQPAPHWIRARRETNTMPQWAGSCWYYLRYTDPNNDQQLASPEALKYWGTPDIYVGGAEHAVLHLLYARFWHKVLHDIGAVPTGEPFPKLFHQGIILGEDGEKMSKSRGNVANPDDIIASHGADTLRLYLMFLGPLEAMKPWNPNGIEGVHRFLQKVWREIIDRDGNLNSKLRQAADASENPDLEKTLHATIKKVTEDIENLRYNTAISQMMIFVNAWQKSETATLATAKTFLQLLAPFAPHIAEELWHRLGETTPIMSAKWPAYDPAKLVTTEQKIAVQINGKRRAEIALSVDATEAEALAAAQSNPEAAPHLAGKQIKKVIYVPKRILNLVVG